MIWNLPVLVVIIYYNNINQEKVLSKWSVNLHACSTTYKFAEL
jgi:hypothetical protein